MRRPQQLAQTFSSQNYSLLVLSSNYVCSRRKCFSFVYDIQLRQISFNWSFMSPQSNIVFTSCQANPADKISKPKIKLLQKNALKEGLFLLMCGLNWSNLSNLFAGLEFEFCLKHEYLRWVFFLIHGPKYKDFDKKL